MVFGGRKAKMSRLERNDRRENISVGVEVASLLTSMATFGLTLMTVLNRKPREDPSGEPLYYMSESMGLIRWERSRRHPSVQDVP